MEIALVTTLRSVKVNWRRLRSKRWCDGGPLMALSRHGNRLGECPLSGV